MKTQKVYNNVTANISEKNIVAVIDAATSDNLKDSRKKLASANKEASGLGRVLKAMTRKSSQSEVKSCGDYVAALEKIALASDGKTPLFGWATIRSPRAFLDSLHQEMFLPGADGKRTEQVGLWRRFAVWAKDKNGDIMRDADGDKIQAVDKNGNKIWEYRLHAVNSWTPNKVWTALVQTSILNNIEA